MGVIYQVFGTIMSGIYDVVKNYGLAIIVFTFITKLVLLPVSVWVQKNSIKMVKMQPEINFLKVNHFGDPDTIAEEQSKIFKREKYNPMASVIPLIIQLILLMGVIEAIKAGIGNPEIDMSFLGMNLSEVPSEKGGMLIFSPIAAGFSAWLLCVAQNRSNVLQSEQSALNKYGTMTLSVGLSLYLGWFVSVGVAVYWIASNLMAIAQQYILNWAINPKKYVDYEKLEESKKALQELKELGGKKKKLIGDAQSKRERADYKRFFQVANKHIVFYSESSGFYKYYKGIIEYILEHTNITIHYITSDPDDAIFKLAEGNDKIRAYYIGEKRLITLMMKMDADIVVMTMPDLENYHIKRSYIRKDIEYIYIPHGQDSLNLTMRKGSMDHFDTIFCVGKHQKEEVEKTEAVYGLPKKKLVEWGYSLLDEMTAEYEKECIATTDASPEDSLLKTILIAPSWQKDNIVDSCLETILKNFEGSGYKVVVRPHPQHVRHKQAFIEHLKDVYKDDDHIEIQTDFSSNSTVFEADLLITDWSGIAYEYAYTTKKPVMFINTPMKIMNPEYTRIDTVPLNIFMRDEIGCSLSPDNLDDIKQKADELIGNSSLYHDKISQFVDEYVYNHGNAAKVGADYIIESLQNKIKQRKENK